MKNLSVTLVRKPSRRFATPEVEAIKRIAGELIRSSDNNYNSYDDIGRVDDVYESLSRMLEEWSKPGAQAYQSRLKKLAKTLGVSLATITVNNLPAIDIVHALTKSQRVKFLAITALADIRFTDYQAWCSRQGDLADVEAFLNFCPSFKVRLKQIQATEEEINIGLSEAARIGWLEEKTVNGGIVFVIKPWTDRQCRWAKDERTELELVKVRHAFEMRDEVNDASAQTYYNQIKERVIDILDKMEKVSLLLEADPSNFGLMLQIIQLDCAFHYAFAGHDPTAFEAVLQRHIQPLLRYVYLCKYALELDNEIITERNAIVRILLKFRGDLGKMWKSFEDAPIGDKKAQGRVFTRFRKHPNDGIAIIRMADELNERIANRNRLY